MHKKDDLIEIVGYSVVDTLPYPYFDVRKLHYRVIKIVAVYSTLDSVEYKAQLVYDQEAQENPPTEDAVYYSDYQTQKGVWYIETQHNTGVKAFSLNAVFLQLVELMKEAEYKKQANENFLDLLSAVTCFREACVALLEA